MQFPIDQWLLYRGTWRKNLFVIVVMLSEILRGHLGEARRPCVNLGDIKVRGGTVDIRVQIICSKVFVRTRTLAVRNKVSGLLVINL